MTETERELDLLVAELESELRRMKTQNETLKRELIVATNERDGIKKAMERILAISRVAVWDSRPEGTSQVGPKEPPRECND